MMYDLKKGFSKKASEDEKQETIKNIEKYSDIYSENNLKFLFIDHLFQGKYSLVLSHNKTAFNVEEETITGCFVKSLKRFDEIKDKIT